MLFDVYRLRCYHLPVYYSVNVFVRPCFCLCKTQHVRRSLQYTEALQQQRQKDQMFKIPVEF